jgi:hypothetical protein
VIGSVANYFKGFGWQNGMPRITRCSFATRGWTWTALLAPDILPTFSAASMAAKGALLDARGQQHNGPLALVELQNGDAPALRGRHRKLLRHHALQLEQLLRHGGDRTGGVLRNETFQSAVIPFADPTSKRQAIFLTNSGVQQSSPHMSGSQAIMGYTRDYYRGLSVVSLQHSCLVTSRKTVDIQLEAKVSGVFDPPIARFNRVQLPESFVTRINQLLKTNSDRNAAFYRSLFPTPTAPASPLRPTQPQAPETR